jgi:hypothetical protein
MPSLLAVCRHRLNVRFGPKAVIVSNMRAQADCSRERVPAHTVRCMLAAREGNAAASGRHALDSMTKARILYMHTYVFEPNHGRKIQTGAFDLLA